MRNLRILVWAYFFLLVFEGALRKWIIPSLDTPLLVIRDPFVLWIYYEAYRNRLTFSNAFWIPTLVLAFLTTMFSTLDGFGNALITAYGIHADFLQLPLIFLMPQILNRKDVILLGKAIMLASIFVAILMIYQFKAPQESWINKGAMNTWYGTVRPSGPFSFISGPTAFFPLTAAFIFFGFMQPKTYPVWLLASVTFAIMIASACSGSRSVLISMGIVMLAAIFCIVIKGKGGEGMLIAAVILALLIPVVMSLPIFQTGTHQLVMRFADAKANGEDAEGMLDRYTNTMMGPLQTMSDVPFFGNGLGLGTNAASALLHGTRDFMGGEDEWGRVIFENGPIFGCLFILLRIAMMVVIGRCSYDALRRGNVLPILIFAACALLIVNGQWGVPTTLGFSIFGAGLTLAACEEPMDDEEEYDDEDGERHEHEDEHDGDEHGDEEHPGDDHSIHESDPSPAGDKVA